MAGATPAVTNIFYFFGGNELMKHGNYYSCRRLRLLEYLLQKGFEPVQTVPDHTNWRFKNWIFENSAELEAALTEYFNSLKKNA